MDDEGGQGEGTDEVLGTGKGLDCNRGLVVVDVD